MRIWKVRSTSRPDVEHTVTLDDAGSWACTCESFKYRHVCPKHLDPIRVMVESENPPVIAERMDRGFYHARIGDCRIVVQVLYHKTGPVLCFDGKRAWTLSMEQALATGLKIQRTNGKMHKADVQGLFYRYLTTGQEQKIFAEV